MDCIFSKKDFVLCDVPVPQGYPQSQTHVGVKIVEGQYYLSTSPYPSRILPVWKLYFLVFLRKLTLGKANYLYRGEWFENPCLYKGIVTNGDEIPSRFQLIEGSPLMDRPKDLYGYGSYCSDPDIYTEDGTFYILNRETIKHPNPQLGFTDVYLIQGKIKNGAFEKEKCQKLFDNDTDKSPCLIKKGIYYYLSLETNSYNDGKPCVKLNKRTSECSLWNWSEKKGIKLIRGNYEPWHMSVFMTNNKLYTVIACIKDGIKQRCWQMLGEFSDDLSELKIFQTPLSDYNSYRGAAIVRKDGEFILYSTTVHEKVNGSKSVDGRDVIMAHMPFERLLSELRYREKL